MSDVRHDCDEFRDRLLDAIEGEAGAGSFPDLEAHLAQCSRCARDARAMRETLVRVRALPESPVPAGLLDNFAATVQRRIAVETAPRGALWRRAATRLGGLAILRPAPALATAAALGLMLTIGLLRTPRPPQPAPDVLAAGDSLSIAQNLDVLEQLDLLEDLDALERLPLLRAPENGRPPQVG